jgi:putative tricarboxylic transport membrane protein
MPATMRAAAFLIATLIGTAAAAQPVHFDQLRIVAPAAPGGGWDQTARAMQQALQASGLARVAPVENIPGAAGTIGLARFMGAERGNGDAVMISGLIMLGGIVTHRSPVTSADVVPIARLTGEYEVIAVPTSSPIRTFRELVDAFVARPESISWGGGSAGGSDQILAGLIADRRRRRAAPHQLHRLSPAAANRSPPCSAGRCRSASTAWRSWRLRSKPVPLRALAISSADASAGARRAHAARAGRGHRVRELALGDGSARDQYRRATAPRSRHCRHGGDAGMARDPRALPLARSLSGRAALRAVRRGRGSTGEERAAAAWHRRLDGSSTGPYPIVVLAGLLLCGIGAVRETLARRASGTRPPRQRATPPISARWAWSRPALVLYLGWPSARDSSWPRPASAG